MSSLDRTILLLIACAVMPWLLPSSAAAQARPDVERIEPGMVQLTGVAGYQFGGSLDVTDGVIDLDSAPTWTAQAGLRVQDDGFAYVSYTRQSTVAHFGSTDGLTDSSFDLDVGYIQIGGELDLPMSKHLVPFIGLGIGATHFTPKNTGGSTDWFFSGTAFAGAKIPIVEHVGLRTQISFLGTVMSSDASWYCVSAGGATCGVSLNDSNGIIQGNVTAGIYVSF